MGRLTSANKNSLRVGDRSPATTGQDEEAYEEEATLPSSSGSPASLLLSNLPRENVHPLSIHLQTAHMQDMQDQAVLHFQFPKAQHQRETLG
jgi:hypothetical protein